MAKKKPALVNKSKAIRDYKAQHPEAGPTDISEALTKQYGATIQPRMVSNVLTRAKKTAAPKKARRRKTTPSAPKAAPAPASSRNGVQRLKMAAKLITECGGIREAQKALEDANEIVRELR